MRFLDGTFYYSTSWWKVWMPVIRRLLNLFFFNLVLYFFLFLHTHQWNRWSWLGIFGDNIFLLLLPSTFGEMRWASLNLLTIGLTGSLLPLLIMMRRTTPAWTTWFIRSVGLEVRGLFWLPTELSFWISLFVWPILRCSFPSRSTHSCFSSKVG